MTDYTTNLIKRLKGVSLSNNERLAMRERLAAYADMHPATETAAASSGVFGFFASRRFSLYAGALMALLIVGSTVTLAAEGSVPGDSLYALKVHVNEPVMTAFAPTATGQAKIAAEIATRRADEAVVLASRGALTTERQAYLAKEFENRIEIANQKTQELKSTGKTLEAESVKAALAANIAGEAQALGATEDESNDGRKAFLSILVAVNDTIAGDDVETATAVAITVANQSEDATSTEDAAPTLMMAAKTKSAPVAATTTAHAVASQAKGVLRFVKLRYASTTLHTRLNVQLNTGGILTPKTDVAIPTQPVTTSETTLTTGTGN